MKKNSFKIGAKKYKSKFNNKKKDVNRAINSSNNKSIIEMNNSIKCGNTKHSFNTLQYTNIKSYKTPFVRLVNT